MTRLACYETGWRVGDDLGQVVVDDVGGLLKGWGKYPDNAVLKVEARFDAE